MAPRDVADALSALPAGLDLDGPSARDLDALAEELTRRNVPVGRLARGWILGSLQARVAAGYLASWVRSGFASEGDRERLRNEAHLTAALRLLGTMTYLRGAVMKIGQTLANYPTLVPEAFAETLGTLCFEAPPMHFSMLRELLRNELGDDPESLFAEFDTHAFAAASLGQVHRARLETGEEVAVKIQYPGIARTIRDDFRNLGTLMLPMRLARDWDNLREQFDDIRTMLGLETDYVTEARLTTRARHALADLDGVVVPRVHARYSSERVLTTDLLHGVHLEQWLARGPDRSARDRTGEIFLRSAFRLCYTHRFCWADPHPGNVLFLDDGRIGLIDFGCCREYDDEEWHYVTTMEQAYLHGGEALDRGLRLATRRAPDEIFPPEHARLVRAFCDWLWEPLRHVGHFDFGSKDYFPRGMRIFADVLQHRATRSAPVNTWINRNFIGVRSIVCRMGARVDVHALHEREAGPLREG